MRKVIFLELNEINFEAIQKYISRGELPNFGELLDKYGLSTTTSEKEYEQLEPWIQWVTVHTGKALAEHKVFRLGDIESRDIEQIWEQLEEQGIAGKDSEVGTRVVTSAVLRSVAVYHQW